MPAKPRKPPASRDPFGDLFGPSPTRDPLADADAAARSGVPAALEAVGRAQPDAWGRAVAKTGRALRRLAPLRDRAGAAARIDVLRYAREQARRVVALGGPGADAARHAVDEATRAIELCMRAAR